MNKVQFTIISQNYYSHYQNQRSCQLMHTEIRDDNLLQRRYYYKETL